MVLPKSLDTFVHQRRGLDKSAWVSATVSIDGQGVLSQQMLVDALSPMPAKLADYIVLPLHLPHPPRSAPLLKIGGMSSGIPYLGPN